MLLLILLVLAVVFVAAPATRYGGYYPTTWSGGVGWLPLLVVILLLVWLFSRGNVAL